MKNFSVPLTRLLICFASDSACELVTGRPQRHHVQDAMKNGRTVAVAVDLQYLTLREEIPTARRAVAHRFREVDAATSHRNGARLAFQFP